MSYEKYPLFRLLAIVVVAAFGVWAWVSDNWVPLIPTVFVIAVILLVLKRKVTDTVVDERTNAIAYRASRLAFLAFVFLAVTTGITLINLADSASDMRFSIGLTLNYTACALMIFYWLAYIYYNRKFGGKE